MDDDKGAVLGSGWSFPMRVNGRGGISLSRHDQDVEEAIRIILSTARGERKMRPEFGCGIHELIFAPNNATTGSLATYHVTQALEQWEPRIELLDVRVDSDQADGGLLLISLRYRLRATNDVRNLVYPFYLIRPE